MSRPALDRKVLILVLDGLGDLPVAALEGRTPLEAARTPVLDEWATEGICGLVDPIEPGLTVETHAGTGALMGLSAEQARVLSRGPIEAAGAGLDLREGDIALRCNFATLASRDGQLAVRDRRAGRIDAQTGDLAAALNAIPPEDGITTFVEPLHQHRAVLRLSGSDLSAAITDTDPGSSDGDARLEWSRATRAADSDAERTAAALNRFLERAHAVLDGHPVNRERARTGLVPANGILTRGAGAVHAAAGLIAAQGLRGAVIAGDRTILGLGALLGFTPVVDPAFTALPETDVAAKVEAAEQALRTHDIAWLHVKGADIAAHDKDPALKTRVLEALDAALAAIADCDYTVGVTADHTTDSNTGRHTSDPVPTLLRVPGGRRDDVRSFGEGACMRGGLGRLRAPEFLRVLLGAAGLAESAEDAPRAPTEDAPRDRTRSREDSP